MELFTIKEAIQLLKISKATIHRHIKQKKFTVYKVGRGLRIDKDSIISFLNNNKI